jgi:hypothetical protein
MHILFGSINAYLGSRTLKHKAHYTKHLGKQFPWSGGLSTNQIFGFHKSQRKSNPAARAICWIRLEGALSGLGWALSGLWASERFRAARSLCFFLHFFFSFGTFSFPFASGGYIDQPLDPLCVIIGERGLRGRAERGRVVLGEKEL